MLRDQQSIQDIQQAAQEILSFTTGMNQASFAADRRTQAAVLYDIIVIGEAANRLSDDFCEQHFSIPWKNIIGMRNILAHQYDDERLPDRIGSHFLLQSSVGSRSTMPWPSHFTGNGWANRGHGAD